MTIDQTKVDAATAGHGDTSPNFGLVDAQCGCKPLVKLRAHFNKIPDFAE